MELTKITVMKNRNVKEHLYPAEDFTMKLGQSYTNGTVSERFFHSSFQQTQYEMLRSGNVLLATIAVLNPISRVMKSEAANLCVTLIHTSIPSYLLKQNYAEVYLQD